MGRCLLFSLSSCLSTACHSAPVHCLLSCCLLTAVQGIVMGRLRSAQRQREVQVMRFCLWKLGLMPLVAGGGRRDGPSAGSAILWPEQHCMLQLAAIRAAQLCSRSPPALNPSLGLLHIASPPFACMDLVSLNPALPPHSQAEIKEPGFLEGGDFFPMGTDLAMVGRWQTFICSFLFL